MRRLLIRGARELLTVRGSGGLRWGAATEDLGLIPDGAVLVEDGAIREVGPTRRIENLRAAANAEVVEARGCVVMPGFVDCHAHLVSGPESAALSRLKAASAAVLRRASAHGTTTLGAVGGDGTSLPFERKALRVASGIAGDAVRVVPSFRVASGELDGAHLNSAAIRGMARFVSAAFETAHLVTASRLPARFEFTEARKSGAAQPFEGRIHCVEHVEYACGDDLDFVAARRLPAVLLPAAPFFRDTDAFGHAQFLANRGAPLALGSDSGAGTPGCSMQFILWLACRRMRLSLPQAVIAATVNAAHILGIGDRVGSLEPGKSADLILLETPDHRALAFEFGMNLIGMTIQRGRIVYRSGGSL